MAADMTDETIAQNMELFPEIDREKLEKELDKYV